MTNRRVFLEVGIIGLLSQLLTPVTKVVQASSKQSSINQIYQQDLPGLNLKNWTVRAVELTFGAGESPSPPHRHPGFVIGYVLEGQIRFQMEGQPEVLLSKGQVFYEPPGEVHLHAYSASDTKRAKILAFVFGKKGSELLTPV